MWRATIEIGQCWKFQVPGFDTTYLITKFINNGSGLGAWALRPDGVEEVFVYVKDDHSALMDDRWQIISCNPNKSDGSATRECPCGIFRGDCDYHKL